MSPRTLVAGIALGRLVLGAALLATPRKVVVKDNLFDTISGSAILFAGDAQGWYESGSCHDVLVEGNVFRNNLTSRFQFTEGILSAYPEVRRLGDQKQYYHRNLVIHKNVFQTFDVPLLYAKSVDGLRFEDADLGIEAATAAGMAAVRVPQPRQG